MKRGAMAKKKTKPAIQTNARKKADLALDWS